MGVLKWMIFFLGFLFFSLMRALLTHLITVPASHPALKLQPDTQFVTALLGFLHATAIIWWATILWSPAENWLSALAWHWRQASWISYRHYLLSGVPLLAVEIIAAYTASRPNVYAQMIATTLEKLLIIALIPLIGIFSLQVVWLGLSTIYDIWFGDADSIPGIFVFTWRLSGLLIVPVLLFCGTVIMAGISSAILELCRPMVFFFRLLSPYLLNSHLLLKKFVVHLEWRAQRNAAHTSRILLISDLHLTNGGDRPIHSRRRSDDSHAFICSLLEHVRPDLLIIAGDITDTGEPGAWESAHDLLSPIGHEKIFAVPGNHDVHFKRNFFLQHFGSLSVPMEGILKQISTLQGNTVSHFPQLRRYAGLSLVVIGFNSNSRPPGTPLTNAIGLVGQTQIQSAREKLAAIRQAGDIVLIVLHHHILSPAFSPQGMYLRCLDANAMYEFACQAGAAAIIHGHKHMPYTACSPEQEAPLIISCGSTHHLPEGPYASLALEPSAYVITTSKETLQSVHLLRESELRLRAG
ncbi:metallophosphoesterase family protein [Janthinobacterium sp. Mn2066]|uniref:metallophosphoesterase family protein n=1 Tax=Janthinobacterium sp. Mn2066 TaxID=3395264 RepID=UPI003BCB784A